MTKKANVLYALVSAGVISLFFVVWYLVTDVYKMMPTRVLPSPVRVAESFVDKLTSTRPDGATLLQHLAASLQVVLSGYLIGVAIGIPTGVIMAWNKRADMFIRPIFDMFRPVPGIAWIPVMITLFGIGLLSRAMVIFVSSFIACVINSYSGIKQAKAVHLWVGQTFGASNFQLLIHVAFPSSLPMMLTGLRVALGYSWATLVAAELLASNRGLGFMIQQNRSLLRADLIITGIIVIGLTGAFLTFLLTLLEKFLLKGGKW